MKIRYKKMHNILSYSKLIQQAFDESIKNYIKANTILINRNLAYFPGVDVCISNHVGELPPMIMGLEAYFVNDLPEDCVFAVCRKEKTEREQLEEEVRKETARTCIILAKQYQNSKEIVRDIAEKYDIDLENEE